MAAARRGCSSLRIEGPTLLQLQWYKRADGEWCSLDDADAANLAPFGVFVVWRPGESGRAPAVLYVGGGPLRSELGECRRDPVFGGAPGLRVTWATVDPRDVDAVAAYLYQQLRPLWGEVPRPVAARPVNLPLSA